MTSAYLLFDVLVVLGPAVLSLIPGPTFWVRRWPMALLALALGGVPWVLWDVWVAGSHWDFNPSYVLGPEWLGLPLEEWGFFLVVPFACLFSWETLVKGPQGTPRPGLRGWGIAAALAGLVGGMGWVVGWPPYTALSLISLSMPFWFDLLSGGRLFENPRAWGYLALVAGFTLLFNNVLTGLPIVTYDATMQLGIRLGTMPLEDLGFGLGHLGVVLGVYERLRRLPAPRAEARSGSVAEG